MGALRAKAPNASTRVGRATLSILVPSDGSSMHNPRLASAAATYESPDTMPDRDTVQATASIPPEFLT